MLESRPIAPPGREPKRQALIGSFLGKFRWGGCARSALANDASFRRYDRLTKPDGTTAVLMDAPPEHEDVRPFIQLSRILKRHGLSAPEVLGRDDEAGLLIIEDLGDDTFTRVLDREPDREIELYELAIDVLVHLHRRFDIGMAGGVPAYDDGRMLDEARLLPEWFLPHVGRKTLDTRQMAAYDEMWRRLLPLGRRGRQTLVLRDYHVDNLMILKGRRGVAACGILDFQDAVIGPAAYDVVSLLEDARRDLGGDLVKRLMGRYLKAFPTIDREAFGASCAVLAAQRNAKIAGVFVRLWKRDGKSQYMKHVPRVLRLLREDLKHPALRPVKDWMAEHMRAETDAGDAA